MSKKSAKKAGKKTTTKGSSRKSSTPPVSKNPLEGHGAVLSVTAKSVDKSAKIEVKLRLDYKPSLFQELGSHVQGPMFVKFEPAQGDAFKEPEPDPNQTTIPE